MRYGSRHFIQSVIFSPKPFSFMTNLLQACRIYSIGPLLYFNEEILEKNSTFCPSYSKKRNMKHVTRYGSVTKLNL